MTSPLLVDLYAGDLKGKVDVAALVGAGLPWCGVVLKCTQGTYYDGGSWFQTYWPITKTIAGERYGNTWLRGAYHYIDLKQDSKAQADFYLRTIDKAGGWDRGDLWPIVDVEGASNPPDASASLIEDRVSAWSGAIELAMGRKPVLYGNIYLAEHGVKSHMGCQLLWVARYMPTLPPDVYNRIGWSIDELFAWQYAGDGNASLANYPHVSPIGAVDISALTIAGGGDAALAWVRSHLFAESPSQP